MKVMDDVATTTRLLLICLAMVGRLTSVQFSTCHSLCTCLGNFMKCREVGDHNLAVVLSKLPKDITELELQNADNGDTFDVQNEQLVNFPSLKVLRLRGCRRTNLSLFLEL
ncbi:uncharacterized protein LOC124444787 [Xenia sp. Carnegie-2017]|uniref:uncharacterized protein LOC124444787 n=1 Tax=Xenia sp. Carnegie-2017 TaxID=2897299 RepID=UPI001F03922A|nr:uncharacterized protein LOC124444787 [Xenia sp. Carnegie-2017]